jgi:branched-chain amino acid transport system permease protein
VLTIGAYYVILAASWNLLAGFTGQFSLAHHAFGCRRLRLAPPRLSLAHAALDQHSTGIVAAGLGGYLLGRLVL